MSDSASFIYGGIIAASFAFFAGLYGTHRRLQPDKGEEWSIRLTTMIHAGLVTTLAYFACFLVGPWPLTEPGLESNAFHLMIISICLGYFLFDYLWCLRYGTETWVMHVHHWFSLVYLTWGLCWRLSGAEIAGVIFGSEITNPLLQLRWMLKKSGNYETPLGQINDLLFASIFISFRVGVGSYFLYCVLSHPRPVAAVKVGGVVFYAISAIFSFQVMSFAKRKIAAWRRTSTLHPSSTSTTSTSSPSTTATPVQEKRSAGGAKKNQ